MSPCTAEDIEELFYNQKNMISGNNVKRSLQVFYMWYIFFTSMFSSTFFCASYKPSEIECYSEGRNKEKY